MAGAAAVGLTRHSRHQTPTNNQPDLNPHLPEHISSVRKRLTTYEASTSFEMSSGYGLHGGQCSLDIQWHQFPQPDQLTDPNPSPGPGRCFPFWQDVLACYVLNTSADDDSGKKKCGPVLEDYYECLHHKKEVSPSRQRPSPRAFASRQGTQTDA